MVLRMYSDGSLSFALTGVLELPEPIGIYPGSDHRIAQQRTF